MLHNINIRAVLNGFIVEVGCQTVVFESRERLLSELTGYLKNPERVIKEYTANTLHRFKLQCPVAAPDSCQVAAQTPGSPINTAR